MKGAAGTMTAQGWRSGMLTSSLQTRLAQVSRALCQVHLW